MYKKILKTLLLPPLCSKPVSFLASKFLATRIPIFMLHRTYPDHTSHQKHTSSYLRHCLAYLKDHGYRFISVKDILLALQNHTPLPKKSVAFTIDDGFYDQAALAAPVFAEYNCPVTIFLITDFLDGKIWPWFSKIEYLINHTQKESIEFYFGSNKSLLPLTTAREKYFSRVKILKHFKTLPWEMVDERLLQLAESMQLTIPGQAPDEYKPMTWEMARKLEKTCVAFGPHTLTHPILSKTDNEWANREITQSWQRLKVELKDPVPVFCYPNGSIHDYGRREIEIIKGTELLGAVSTIHKQLCPESLEPDEQFFLPRYSLPDSFEDFKMYSCWLEGAKEKLRGKHKITDTLY